MSSAAKASLIFGAYVVVLGVVVLLVPNVLLTTFGFPATNEPWIRVTGVIAAVLGGYYIEAGRRELTAFFRMTIAGRTVVFVAFALLVVVGWAQAPLILFGAVDLAGAVWSAWALRRDARAGTPRA